MKIGKYSSINQTIEIEKNDIVEENQIISATQHYVGCLADINGDEEPDGIIYADLAYGKISNNQNWGNVNGIYNIPKVEDVSILKKYIITKSKITGKFGPESRNVISVMPDSTGEERFYVMSLNNEGNTSFYWYYNFDTNTTNKEDWGSFTSPEFGRGRENTKKMLEKWNSNGYGIKDETYDLWRFIKMAERENEPKWFIPSKEEWSAFAGELEITSDNYKEIYNLGDGYWSSSQRFSEYGIEAWDIYFERGNMFSMDPNYKSLVRLSTTF